MKSILAGAAGLVVAFAAGSLAAEAAAPAPRANPAPAATGGAFDEQQFEQVRDYSKGCQIESRGDSDPTCFLEGKPLMQALNQLRPVPRLQRGKAARETEERERAAREMEEREKEIGEREREMGEREKEMGEREKSAKEMEEREKGATETERENPVSAAPDADAEKPK